MFKSGENVIILGVPFDFKRVDQIGVIVNRMPYENTIWRVKIGNKILPVSDSMIKSVK